MNIIQDNFLIKRSSKTHIESIISQNPNWKVLDIGCGYGANKYATTISDIIDLSNHYRDKTFVKITEKKLPFKDKEFDFVIASHVLEHVENVDKFISELERISTKGYIELPTILEDNLVFENKSDHLWHMEFDDNSNELIISNRIQYLEPILTVSSIKKFDEVFKQSLILELYWEEKINYKKIIKKVNQIKFSRIKLLKKFFSKYLRNLLRR